MDDARTPAPGDFRPRARKVLSPLLTAVVAAAVGAALTYLGVPPKVVERVTEIIREVPATPDGAADGFGPARGGWVRDEDAIADNRDPAKTPQFSDTPAGRAALGGEDVLLYRAVRRAAGKPAPWYPNVNQLSVGCCVGCGFKHGCDVVQATAILGGAPFEWKPTAVEPIYAGSRVEVGGGRLRGDGSVGRWAKEWLQARGGLVPMEKLGRYDLTAFNPSRARQWGTTGVPDDLEPEARKHPVKGTALVTSAADVKRALLQGYPVAVCSNVGFDNRDGTVGTRDRDGFCAPRGTWPHCMCLLGWRGGARPGALCLNSWGDKAHAGPVWPDDMPPAAFWIDESVVERMVRQGDSFALADVQGFPARPVPLDWNVRLAPARRPRPADAFALAP